MYRYEVTDDYFWIDGIVSDPNDELPKWIDNWPKETDLCACIDKRKTTSTSRKRRFGKKNANCENLHPYICETERKTCCFCHIQLVLYALVNVLALHIFKKGVEEKIIIYEKYNKFVLLSFIIFIRGDLFISVQLTQLKIESWHKEAKTVVSGMLWKLFSNSC